MEDDGFETLHPEIIKNTPVNELLPETDPTGRKLGDPGAKMDAGKPDYVTVLEAFPLALAAVSEVVKFGAETKGYGWGAWRDVPDGSARYKKALVRHVIERGKDDESGLDAAAHAAWNALAVLEFELMK